MLTEVLIKFCAALAGSSHYLDAGGRPKKLRGPVVPGRRPLKRWERENRRRKNRWAR